MSPTLAALAFVYTVSAAPVPAAATGPDSFWPYLIGGGGLLGILTWASKTYFDWKTGRSTAKEARTADAILQRDTAWKERDEARKRERAADRRADVADRRSECEARNTRRVLDYAARLRRRLYDLGADDVEPEPALMDCSTITDEGAPERPQDARERPRTGGDA